jgi:hypothetical protein
MHEFLDKYFRSEEVAKFADAHCFKKNPMRIAWSLGHLHAGAEPGFELRGASNENL